eukprot:COSAG01_NODE_503_length_16167_cov_10.407230_19_plen_52_part_00
MNDGLVQASLCIKSRIRANFRLSNFRLSNTSSLPPMASRGIGKALVSPRPA